MDVFSADNFRGIGRLGNALEQGIQFESLIAKALDFGRIRGQQRATDAPCIAAAGGHNLLTLWSIAPVLTLQSGKNQHGSRHGWISSVGSVRANDYTLLTRQKDGRRRVRKFPNERHQAPSHCRTVEKAGRPAGRDWNAAMKTHLIALGLLVALAQPASAQDHLVPDTSAFADPDSYLLKIRHVFAPAFERDVTLRALVLRSFEKEYVVGLRIGDAGAEAFVLEASSSIWDTELLEMYKTGEIGPTITLDGKEIPLEQDEEYKALKKRTPADYRDIKAVRRARPLPRDLTEGIKKLWEVMLLGVRHPEESRDGLEWHNLPLLDLGPGARRPQRPHLVARSQIEDRTARTALAGTGQLCQERRLPGSVN